MNPAGQIDAGWHDERASVARREAAVAATTPPPPPQSSMPRLAIQVSWAADLVPAFHRVCRDGHGEAVSRNGRDDASSRPT